MKNQISYLMKTLLIGIILLPGSFTFSAQQENWTGDLIITLHNSTNQNILPEISGSETLRRLAFKDIAPHKSGGFHLSETQRRDAKTISIHISNLGRVHDPTF